MEGFEFGSARSSVASGAAEPQESAAVPSSLVLGDAAADKTEVLDAGSANQLALMPGGKPEKWTDEDEKALLRLSQKTFQAEPGAGKSFICLTGFAFGLVGTISALAIIAGGILPLVGTGGLLEFGSLALVGGTLRWGASMDKKHSRLQTQLSREKSRRDILRAAQEKREQETWILKRRRDREAIVAAGATNLKQTLHDALKQGPVEKEVRASFPDPANPGFDLVVVIEPPTLHRETPESPPQHRYRAAIFRHTGEGLKNLGIGLQEDLPVALSRPSLPAISPVLRQIPPRPTPRGAETAAPKGP